MTILALCVACGTKPDANPDAESDERSVFERGTWALSTFDGRQSPDSYTICNYEFSYNELSATYTARNERIPRIWELGDTTVRYTLEYRADGTLKHKEVEGKQSARTLEVYDYDERGDLARYERIVSGTPIEIKTYSIAYENDVPKSATVTVTNPSDDAEETASAEEDPAADSHTYELVLHTDDDDNVVSADSDGRGMASMSWVYIENPNPLSRPRIQAEAASAFEQL